MNISISETVKSGNYRNVYASIKDSGKIDVGWYCYTTDSFMYNGVFINDKTAYSIINEKLRMLL